VLPESVTLFAPAKLTLSLRVTGVRDDGMHLIDAEMVSLDFGDTLVVGPGDGVVYTGVYSGEDTVTSTVTSTGSNRVGAGDLVARALALLGERRRVDVTKRIPAGAGLGGGSSDAAALLAAGGVVDPRVAVELGADVAFCLVGGRARVQGIGEELEPLPYEPRTFTLLTPPLHCSTPAVYRAWDRLGGPSGERGNDLEPAAVEVEPRMAEWRDRLADHAQLPARLAGSGSTWFVEGAFPGPGMRVVRTTPPRTTVI